MVGNYTRTRQQMPMTCCRGVASTYWNPTPGPTPTDARNHVIRRLHDQRSRSRLALERLEVSDPMVEELGRNIERHIQAPAYVDLERRFITESGNSATSQS